ncbi:beta-1 [Forsythia ovata]|uniref:Beta-1 n=1 Tax=Forsythia ovata TaxID=205694 RepID=A0ABD1PYA9_9LAMI
MADCTSPEVKLHQENTTNSPKKTTIFLDSIVNGHLHRRDSLVPPPHDPDADDVYNIIPIHNLLADHPSIRYSKVRAAATALRTVGDLRRPLFSPWQPHYDLFDWLALFFGFQSSNVRNQREHIVIHLSNAQMRLPLIWTTLIPSIPPFSVTSAAPSLRTTPTGALTLTSSPTSSFRILVDDRYWH